MVLLDGREPTRGPESWLVRASSTTQVVWKLEENDHIPEKTLEEQGRTEIRPDIFLEIAKGGLKSENL